MNLATWLRIVAILIGALALAALIWFGGPFVAFGEVRPFESIWVRLPIAVLLLVGALGWIAVIVIRRRKATAALTEALEKEETTGDGAALSSAMKDALATLKSARGKGGDYLYDLPYAKGKQYRVEQGYNGVFSHRGENSLDFNMKQGTPVRAAREGLVIAVVQRFSESCWSDACRDKANYVLVYHSDGTIGDYSHLQYNGARVVIGDTVRKGQLIALSGNTGYTRGPHLHFDCYLPGIENKRTVMTRFRITTGKTWAYLKEGKWYRKNY